MINSKKLQSAVLFLGGSADSLTSPSASFFLAEAKVKAFPIIAVDHGADLALKVSFIPQIVIGDNDSISPETQRKLLQKNVPFLKYPTQKDRTDTELALEYLEKNSFTDVTCFGLEGNRSDHFLANIFVFSHFVTRGMTIRAVGQTGCYYFFKDEVIIKGRVGDLLTLLALTPKVSGLSSQGLGYPLNNQQLVFGTSLGVSNFFNKSETSIKLKTGALLAIHTPI